MGHMATLVGKESGNARIRLLSSASLVGGSKGREGKNWLLQSIHRVYLSTSEFL